MSDELELGTQALEHKWMSRGQAVGYEEGYKRGRKSLMLKLSVLLLLRKVVALVRQMRGHHGRKEDTT